MVAMMKVAGRPASKRNINHVLRKHFRAKALVVGSFALIVFLVKQHVLSRCLQRAVQNTWQQTKHKFAVKTHDMIGCFRLLCLKFWIRNWQQLNQKNDNLRDESCLVWRVCRVRAIIWSFLYFLISTTVQIQALHNPPQRFQVFEVISLLLFYSSQGLWFQLNRTHLWKTILCANFVTESVFPTW